VQRDGGPHATDAVLGHAVGREEFPGLLRAVDLEATAAVVEPVTEPQIMEHGADVEQFGVEAQVPVAALQASEEIDPA
jgi:hypothetical protein